MICSPNHTADDDRSCRSSSSGAGQTGSGDADLLVLFSDDDDEEEEDDGHSFFEIAIHHHHHHHHKQITEVASDHSDSASAEEEISSDDEIELRISFSSTSLKLIPSSNSIFLPKSRSLQQDLLKVASTTSPEFCPYVVKSRVAEEEQLMPPQVSANAILSLQDKPIRPNSNWELIPGYCFRKPSKSTTTPAMNGSGILNFLFKFPATVKIQRLLSSLAKATTKSPSPPNYFYNSPHEQGNNVNNRSGPSQVSKRLQYYHKFIKKSLNKWLVPITKELGLKNIKNYCHFDETDLIIISSERKRNKNVKSTKTKGGSNPSSMKSSPIHSQNSTSGHYDHHQSSIQSAIAHCRRSSICQQTSDFCFSTSRC